MSTNKEPQEYTTIWRVCLGSIAIFNSIVLASVLSKPWTTSNTIQRLVGIPYVFQTIYRSYFISEYVNLYTVTDSKWNSPMLARLMAVVGELCFGVQIVMALESRWKHENESILLWIQCLAILLDFTGQCCCTMGITLRCQLLMLIEGVMWTLLAVLCFVASLFNEFQSDPFWMSLGVASGCGSLYMLFVYCPMEYAKWIEIGDGEELSWDEIKKGFYRAWITTNQTNRWGVWKQLCLWQTIYFSFGAWWSMYFML